MNDIEIGSGFNIRVVRDGATRVLGVVWVPLGPGPFEWYAANGGHGPALTLDDARRGLAEAWERR